MSVLVRNTSNVIQALGQWLLKPGATELIPLSIVPSFGDTVEIVREVPRAAVTIYRSPCNPTCGHSLCTLTRGLTQAMRDLGVQVERLDWRLHEGGDQPMVGQGRLCNSATFVGPAGRFGWVHADSDVVGKRHLEVLDRGWDGFFVSSSADKAALERSGLASSRIHVVNDAIDADLYRPEGPTLDKWGDHFVILSLGAQSPRKGFDVLLEAYGRAFTAADDVVLVFKNYSYGRDAWCRQVLTKWQKQKGRPAVEYIYETWEPVQVAAAYRRVAKRGVYCMPSRVEGFGLTGLEALACGCRLGVTGWSGPLDYATSENATLFPYTLGRNDANPEAFAADEDPHWADPDVDAVAGWMRQMYETEPDRQKQAAIAEDLRSRFTYENMARGYCAALGVDVPVRPRGVVGASPATGARPATGSSSPAASPTRSPITHDETLGIGIPTRDRPGYLAALLGALLTQTKRPDALCIVDDGGQIRKDPAVLHLLRLFEKAGARTTILPGTQKGASQNHEKARQWLGTELVLRLDDDVLPADGQFVARLYADLNRFPEIGAVAGCYPCFDEQPRDYQAHRAQPGMTNTIADMLADKAGLQMRNWTGAGEVMETAEHLYSSWMYRNAYLQDVGGFADCYTRFGQREESDASIRLHLLGGHRLLVDTGAVAWHFLAGGGRRPEQNRQTWSQDEATFRARLEEWRRAR